MKNKGVFVAAILTAVLCISGNVLALSGLGTQVSPYLITSPADFDEFANPANSATYWGSGVYTKLTLNLDLAGPPYTRAVIAPDTDSITPGFQGTQFAGLFDGDDHKISYLTIYASTKEYIGLFGYVGYGGQIKNLGVENVTITGRYRVGGLVGDNYGTLTSCYATGSVTGSYTVGGLVGWNDAGTLTSCYTTGSVSGADSVGGLVGSNGSAILSCYATGPVSGNIFVGGLVGANGGGQIITSCYATGSVTGSYSVGGLAGQNNGGLDNCYATGPVTGTGGDSAEVGGLVGGDYGGISYCYSMGFVSGSLNVGGLVGNKPPGTTAVVASFWDVDSSGQPTSAGEELGKTTVQMKMRSTFVGWDFEGSPPIWVIVENTTYPYFWGSTVTVPNTVPSVVGMTQLDAQSEIVSAGLTVGTISYEYSNTVTAGLVISQSPAAGSSGSSVSIVVSLGPLVAVPDVVGMTQLAAQSTIVSAGLTVGIISNAYSNTVFAGDVISQSPVFGSPDVGNGSAIDIMVSLGLPAYSYSDGDGSIVDPFQIWDIADFNLLTLDPDNWDKSFILMANINLTGQIFTKAPIAPDTSIVLGFQGTQFTGSFDGRGHIISNLTIDAPTDFIALFGCVGSVGQIRNLGVENVNLTGRYRIGGLVGWNYGMLTSCYATGPVSGIFRVGGLVGWNNDGGSITSCYATCSVGLSSYNTLSTWPEYFGGLVGENGGSLTSCYATGALTISSSGGSGVGGLAGSSYYGTVTDCFWDMETSGKLTSSGGTGKTTAEMKTLATFTDAGWDFSATDGDPADWWMPANDYPRMAWEDWDGITDAVEDLAPNDGDGNLDGIPDSQQDNVASLPNAVNGNYVSLVTPEPNILEAVNVIGNPDSSGNWPLGLNSTYFPIGFFEFTVSGISLGGSTTVTIFYSGQTVNTYYKYGKETVSDSNHWYPFIWDGTTGAEFPDSNHIILHFVDGGRGDDDCNANGQIVEPGGPAFIATFGSLQVTLSPVAAVMAGAQWNVDGGAWQNSGDTVSGLSVGSYTVTYKAVTGWTAPSSESASITDGGTTAISRSYIQQTGSLQVTLGPAAAVTAGAKWSVDGGTTWNDSTATVTGLSVGSYTVTYKAVTGWTAPASESASITDGVTTTISRSYIQQTGYSFGGILQPINADGSSVFKLGSTVQVKFQLRDAAGNFVTNAVAKLYLTKIANAVEGSDLEAVSTSAATTGNLFRYADNQYIFNLGTKSLTAGTWRLEIALDDGTSRYVDISLRK